MESFEPMVTKLHVCSGEKMLYKINQREIIQQWNNVELRFLRIALRIIARSMHTKFGVIWPFDDKVTLRTRNGLYNQSKGNNYKTEQCGNTVFVHIESLPEACIPSLESFGPMVTRKAGRRGHGRRRRRPVIPICRLFRRHKKQRLLIQRIPRGF